jgi:hypothetical protein
MDKMDNLITQFNKSENSEEFEFEFEAQIFSRKVTKMHYNQVIQWLLMAGFTMKSPNGTDILRIQQDIKQNEINRTELTGFDSIRHYCQTEELINPVFIHKERLGFAQNENYWTNFTLAKETKLKTQPEMRQKKYRLMNRIQLSSTKYPFKYDCTIVRSSRPNDTLESLFTIPPTYEIEVEFARGDVKKQIQRAITYALRGIQRSNYPIGQKEFLSVQKAYKSLVKSDGFIGPRAVSIQASNLTGTDNIYENFVVTEKTDGERKMLFIVDEKAYFIVSGNLDVEYTGISGIAKDTNMTLMDGEHVTHDKTQRINSYFAFDLYFGKFGPNHHRTFGDIRTYRFIDTKNTKTDTRYKELCRLVKKIPTTNLMVSPKTFKDSTPENCKDLLTKIETKIEQGGFPYETDGLIFTPSLYGVGMSSTVETLPKGGSDWYLNLKWKPPKDNTIDFLVHFGDDAYTSGMANASTYKKVNLLVGFTVRDVLANSIHSIFEGYDQRQPANKQVLFKPGNPSCPDSHVTNLLSIQGKIRTEKGEIIEHGRIVEFRYDKDKPLDHRWTPLRVRWDKTKPNGFTTAASNWFTIQNPITEGMLTGQEQALTKSYYAEEDDDRPKKKRSAYQTFHNDVKRELLSKYVEHNSLVIDFAVGRGGDLPKLKMASFVLGIDVDEKSITGKNGVCERYLGLRGWSEDGYTPSKYTTRGIFLQGNSTLNIKSGEGIQQEYHKCIVRSIFGLDPKRHLGTGIDNHYGKAKLGFNVASIQFAVHYMFQNITTLTRFIQNVAECTKLKGYFVGTCYDGQEVFDRLRDKHISEAYEIKNKSDELICKITKEYKQQEVQYDESCLGYTIKVLQAEINNEHEEWLVFFPYFESIMEQYGFKRIARTPFKEYYSDDRGMEEGEQELSFLNTTFAFQKVKEVFAPAKLNYIVIPLK